MQVNRYPLKFTGNNQSGMTTVTMLKLVLAFLLVILAGISVAITLNLKTGQKPNKMILFGSWIEVGAPKYNTDTYTINKSGVYKNSRLLTTNYQFDGSELVVETGGGRYVYLLETKDSPQLKRVHPRLPQLQLVKKGYEHTVDMEGSSYMRKDEVGHYFKTKKVDAPVNLHRHIVKSDADESPSSATN